MLRSYLHHNATFHNRAAEMFPADLYTFEDGTPSCVDIKSPDYPAYYPDGKTVWEFLVRLYHMYFFALHDPIYLHLKFCANQICVRATSTI